MAWLFIVGSIWAAWLAWSAVSLFLNFRIARNIGLPIIISPLYSMNPLWMLVNQQIGPFLRSLPWGMGRFARYNYISWTFDEKYAVHQALGNTFTLVTPSSVEVVLADPEMVNVVFARRKEFIKPPFLYEPLNVFGRNVNTLNGDDWQRHRKITAPSFNERVSNSVWMEATRQAEEMMESWIQQDSKGTAGTVSDTATLALHVLTYSGFGIQYSFGKGVQRAPPGHAMAYRDALMTILQNVLIFAILPRKVLESSRLPLPKKLRRFGQATKEFGGYMTEMLARERLLISRQEGDSGNLMSALIRASEDAEKGSPKENNAQGLTNDEIFGNIFVYNLAGHETTANTVAFAIVLLAAHPRWQDWIAEEINDVLGRDANIELSQYEAAFPKLKRCLAIMLETLRLYGSVIYIPRALHPDAPLTSFITNSQSFSIPPGTLVTVNIEALHTDPKEWGTDALSWNPGRWICLNSRAIPEASEAGLGSERLLEPRKGSYVPWADGPRECPGQKFSKVEFVAVMAVLFRKGRVNPTVLQGEEESPLSLMRARNRLMEIVDNSSIQAITLQMQDLGRNVRLVWRKEV